MSNKVTKAKKLIGRISQALVTPQRPPIYVIGLPRSGTTWMASILNTATAIKYYYEPFNPVNVPESRPYWRKYLRGDDQDEAFSQYCQDAFTGRIKGRYILNNMAWEYQKLPWLPGRVMVKDVHCCLALEWIYQQLAPQIVIILRHPCAIAASWYRLAGETELPPLQRLLEQPQLMSDYLQPFESVLRGAKGFWQGMGAFWGASYYVMLQQQKQHPDWLVVSHEALCEEPEKLYRQLFQQLNLNWTDETDVLLNFSISKDSGKPYIPQRILEGEVDKWQNELTVEQIEQVQQFVKPFGVNYYPDF